MIFIMVNPNNLIYNRLISTYKCCVCQDNLRFVGKDVELDDVAITVSVDDLRVCAQKQREQRRTHLYEGLSESCAENEHCREKLQSKNGPEPPSRLYLKLQRCHWKQILSKLHCSLRLNNINNGADGKWARSSLHDCKVMWLTVKIKSEISLPDRHNGKASIFHLLGNTSCSVLMGGALFGTVRKHLLCWVGLL